MPGIVVGVAILAWLLVAGGPAQAHDVVSGVGGLPGGLLHPLLVPAHALALLALGLALGQQPRWRAGVLLFGVGLVAGITLIVAAFAITTDTAVLAVAAMAGMAVAVGRRLPLALAGPLAIVAGMAVALDSVPQEISMQTTFLALVGTAISATLAVMLVAGLSRRLARDWQRIGLRIVGSWIAASAILVLAVRLGR